MAYAAYPAPVGGWNARDDLGNMPPEDAVVLRNWRPRPGYLETRGGTSGTLATPTGVYDQVGTIVTFRSTFGDVLLWTGGDYIWAWEGGFSSPSAPYTGTSFTG